MVDSCQQLGDAGVAVLTGGDCGAQRVSVGSLEHAERHAAVTGAEQSVHVTCKQLKPRQLHVTVFRHLRKYSV